MTITRQPQYTGTVTGDGAEFSIATTGNAGPVTYQWEVELTSNPGVWGNASALLSAAPADTTDTLTIASTVAGDVCKVRCTVDDGTTASTARLELDLSGDPFDFSPAGYTLMMLFETDSTAPYTPFSSHYGGDQGMRIARASSIWRIYGHDTPNDTTIPMPAINTPTTAAISVTATADTTKFYDNGVPYSGNPLLNLAMDPGENINVITFMNRAWTSVLDDPLRGRAAIMLFYKRQLTDQEVLDAHNLMMYWAENGSGP